MISSEPNYFPKALYLNTITLGRRASMCEFGCGDMIQSRALALPHLTLNNPMTQVSIQDEEKEA